MIVTNDFKFLRTNVCLLLTYRPHQEPVLDDHPHRHVWLAEELRVSANLDVCHAECFCLYRRISAFALPLSVINNAVTAVDSRQTPPASASFLLIEPPDYLYLSANDETMTGPSGRCAVTT